MKKLLSIAVVSALSIAAAACSSTDTTVTGTPAPQDTGPTGNGGASGDKNPNGVAYPTANLGHVVGTVIPNLKFVGYRAANTAGVVDTTKTTTIQLADLFNPDGKNGTVKLIHLSASSRWCGPCNEETSMISGYKDGARIGTGVAANLDSKGVVFLQALVDGFTPGKGATVLDLQGWVSDHASNFTQVLDNGPTAFASFFSGAAVPWNADVDATTMKILKTELGYDPNLETTISGLVAKISFH
jgi:hypothetical protein